MGMMTPKDLRIQLKYGKTSEELMARYNFRSEEELISAIRRIMSCNSYKVIQELFQNNKRSRKSGQTTELQSEETKDTPEGNEPNEELNDEAIENVEDAVEDDESQNHSLKEFEEYEEEISNYLRKLESEHKEMVSKRKSIVESLRGSKNALQELQRLLERQKERVVGYYEEYESIALAMNEKSREINSYRELLEEVRQQIEELSKVYIYISGDGTIEADGVLMPTISEEELATVLSNLILRPDAEEWTIKVLKNMARVHLMVREYAKSGEKIEILFESEELQEFYETIA